MFIMVMFGVIFYEKERNVIFRRREIMKKKQCPITVIIV